MAEPTNTKGDDKKAKTVAYIVVTPILGSEGRIEPESEIQLEPKAKTTVELVSCGAIRAKSGKAE